MSVGAAAADDAPSAEVSLQLPPGTYEVSAAMPGQADTEKRKSVTISEPGASVGVDFAF